MKCVTSVRSVCVLVGILKILSKIHKMLLTVAPSGVWDEGMKREFSLYFLTFHHV